MAERMWHPISKLDFWLTTRRAGSGMCGRTPSRCGAPSIYSARESRGLLVRPRQMGREDSDPRVEIGLYDSDVEEESEETSY